MKINRTHSVLEDMCSLLGSTQIIYQPLILNVFNVFFFKQIPHGSFVTQKSCFLPILKQLKPRKCKG